MSVLDQPAILQALFHPRNEYGPVPPGVHLVTIEVEPAVTVGGRLYPAGYCAPAILYFHGNGEIAADYDDIARSYVRLGITLLVMDFRGYGRSEGTPTATNLLADALTVFEATDDVFDENGLSPARLYVMGRSLGSAAAIEVALQAREQLAGLIVESGFADTFALVSRLGVHIQGVDELDGFGNPAKMERITVPSLIIHGQNDAIIPVTDGYQLYTRCVAQDKWLVVIPYAGHNDLMLIGVSQYFEAVQTFVTGEAEI